MQGRPGLLLRGKQFQREDFEKLTQTLGEFVPNCQRKPKCQDDGYHENQCFQMECDISLIYPGEEKLHVRLAEVKRPRDDVFKESTTKRLLKEASEQLEKDVKLINWILKDISPEKLDIKTFVVLDIPEEQKDEDMLKDYTDTVLVLKDIENNYQQINQSSSFISSNNEIHEYFWTACGRLQSLVGGFETKILQQSHDWMIKYQDSIEKQLIIFNQHQRKIVSKLSDSNRIKNFSFCGGAGTGKTLMAIKCCNSLLERYKNCKVQVYLTTMTQWLFSVNRGLEESEPVLKLICENINTDRRENVQLKMGPLRDICKEMGIVIPDKNDDYIRHICSIINSLAQKLKAKHQNVPVILLVDEIWYDQNDIHGDAKILTPPGHEDDITDPGSIVHLILAHNPVSQGSLQFPETSSKGVLNSTFTLRYRNTIEIQKLSQLVTQGSFYPDLEEEHVPRVAGDIPCWINLGDWDDSKMSLLQSSLDQMMTKTGNSDDVILLYHPELPVSMREYLLNNATTATLVTTSCAGAEWDSVIYVGYGHTEAFSRAKLTLGIITINCHTINQFVITNILKDAVNRGMVRKIEV